MVIIFFSDDVLSSDEGNNIPFAAIVLAAIASLNSVGASVYQETLFKVDYYSFVDQKPAKSIPKSIYAQTCIFG